MIRWKMCIGFILWLMWMLLGHCSPMDVTTPSTILRRKRQNNRRSTEAITSPSPEYIKELENFWPAPSSRCPHREMICYDESYCFNENQLCHGRGPCLDSSNNINAYCMGKTTTPAVYGSTKASDEKPDSSNPTSQSGQGSKEPSNIVTHPSSFSHPLVISFFVLVGGLLVYVAMATVCCVAMRWNAVAPRPLGAQQSEQAVP